MLSILGNRVKLCDGITRREMLRVGGLAFSGLAWSNLLRAQQPATGPSRGSARRAKACIVVFNYGGPSHIDTFDLKPDAPREIRGEFNPIATRVAGTQISEHLPRMARIADKYTIIRSVHHRDNDHAIGAYLALTGYSHPRNDVLGIEFPMAPTDLPSMGSVLSKIRPNDRPIFTYVTLGDLRHFGHHDSLGQGAGCLGRTYDPYTLPFVTRSEQQLDLSSITSVTARVDGRQLASRQQLLQQVSSIAPALERTADMRNLDVHTRRAFELLSARQTRDAFDVAREPQRVRDFYGPSAFGQNCLLARRLVEAGVPMITLYGFANRDWDTHGNNFNELKNKLLPPTDRGLSALLEDLEQRGLLDETLVVWMGDMGRTPRINNSAGRDHWSFCYSVVLAGGGIRPGMVHGSSDRAAGYPAEHQVSPADIAATIYQQLGIDPRGHVTDQQGRPLVVSTGNPIRAILA
jgi:hypothetical protein